MEVINIVQSHLKPYITGVAKAVPEWAVKHPAEENLSGRLSNSFDFDDIEFFDKSSDLLEETVEEPNISDSQAPETVSNYNLLQTS